MHFLKLAVASALITSMTMLGACAKKQEEQNSSDNSITATTPVSGEASTLTERNAQQRLLKQLQSNLDKAGLNAKILNIRNTEIPNMYWVTLDGFPAVLASSDGKYIFQGEVIKLGDKKVHRISEDLQAYDNKAAFESLDPKDMIIYKAKGKTKHVIYVFTDASCPYCHRFHNHMDEMNAKGIEVRYIAWPRGEQFFPTMQNIWCSEDRKAALDTAFAGLEVHANQCKNPVMAQYKLGTKIGVNGTPAVYSTDGVYLGGYLETAELVKRLENR